MAVNSGKSPRIRLVGSRIYDSVNGKTCHQRGKENSVTANKSKKVYKRKLEKEAIAEMHNCNKKKRGAEGTDIDKSNKMKRGGII
ncbi:hypothetical protein SASPL_135526 [Salvia splendens]|uniref:Uncharacterized protein n=1 Tax=Salvia splendens TaxID=180675 RepID=A0A8X8WZ16_SALSN|nr:hypothetical protein SASPL_135526 [Salvia splendens]